MASQFEKLEKELGELLTQGDHLLYSMADNVGQLPKTFKDGLKAKNIELPNFSLEYDNWYSEALRVVKQIIPDRTDDFIKQYKNEKRKEIDFLTYGIADYLLGLKTSLRGETVADQSAAVPKMKNQVAILGSAKKRFKSALFDITDVLQADLFDSELDAAKSLTKAGFVRAGGAVAGVVLEKHLRHTCDNHRAKLRKAHPSLSDYNQALKDASAIDTPTWRFIQHLTDIRNLCDHGKERDPTKEEVLEMIQGVEKIIKTVH